MRRNLKILCITICVLMCLTQSCFAKQTKDAFVKVGEVPWYFENLIPLEDGSILGLSQDFATFIGSYTPAALNDPRNDPRPIHAGIYNPKTGILQKLPSAISYDFAAGFFKIDDERILLLSGGNSYSDHPRIKEWLKAEIYYPKKGTIELVGTRSCIQAGQAAILLNKNQILTAGRCQFSDKSVIEIIDLQHKTIKKVSEYNKNGLGEPILPLENNRFLLMGTFPNIFDLKTGFTTNHLYHDLFFENARVVKLNDGRYLILAMGYMEYLENATRMINISRTVYPGIVTNTAIFDPKTERFTFLAQWFKNTDSGFSATTLKNGKVIVVGGSYPPLDSRKAYKTNLYNPETYKYEKGPIYISKKVRYRSPNIITTPDKETYFFTRKAGLLLRSRPNIEVYIYKFKEGGV